MVVPVLEMTASASAFQRHRDACPARVYTHACTQARVKAAIAQHAAAFANDFQQDAHEFFGLCVDRLHDELQGIFLTKKGCGKRSA